MAFYRHVIPSPFIHLSIMIQELIKIEWKGMRGITSQECLFPNLSISSLPSPFIHLSIMQFQELIQRKDMEIDM